MEVEAIHPPLAGNQYEVEMSDSSLLSAPPKSTAVTSLACVNFLLGALRFVLGVALVIVGVQFIGSAAQIAENPAGANAPAGPQPIGLILVIIDLLGAGILLGIILLVGALFFALAGVFVVIGILMVIAGLGLATRRKWGRWLTLALGCAGGALAALYFAQLVLQFTQQAPGPAGLALSLAGILVHGGYCVFVFTVLLNRRYAAEFA